MKFRGLHDSEYSAYLSKPKVHLEIGKDGYTEKAIAQVVSRLTRGENTYILYSYSASILDYLFAWVTPFDEMHRSMGNHRREWYDGLVQDIEFKVSYDSKKPWLHKVETAEFNRLNYGSILFLGEK